MIGNDIVDLKFAVSESNWKRRGYLQKLFTRNEQEAILANPFPERKLWSFWAMKEATYKAHQRRFLLPRSYNPRFFICTEINRNSGYVQAGDFIYYTRILKNENYIHCISSAVQKKKYICEITGNYDGFKEGFLENYAGIANLPMEIQIKKNGQNIPQLFWQNKLITADFSFSHHGRYWAYVAAR